MYSTHDYSPQNTGFLMKDWRVWQSSDLVSWSLASTLQPQDTPAPSTAYSECWATDGAFNGTHYAFYLSTGPTDVAVMVSSVGPAGPWVDPLGKLLLNSSLGNALNPSTQIRDPCAFTDDDGTHYIVFGTFNYYIAKLNSDMVTLAEAPHYITVLNPTGPYGNKTDDKPFMHKYGGLYYLSWGCFYGTSTTPYGPFTYVGSVVDTNLIEPAFRMNQTSGPWYGWEDYADRHGSFWTANNQWFYSANDRSHSTDAANPSVYRDTVLAYVDYYSNGTIAPVVINGIGVGEYGFDEVIEAEHYMAMAHASKGHTREGRFGVHNVSRATVLSYPNVRGVRTDAALSMVFRVAQPYQTPSPVSIVARVGHNQGHELCRTEPRDMPATQSWETFEDVECKVALPPSSSSSSSLVDLDVVLTFEGDDTNDSDGHELLRLDSFRFRVM